jgi:hypothetical protein
MAQAKNINRSVYGQYGLTQLDGFEVPYLSASQAERLANPGERWANASHGQGSSIKDLGWSGNSFSNALSRGAAAFGVQKSPISPPSLNSETEGSFNFINQGYTGVPTEPAFGYQITGDLQGLAKKFNIDASNLTPYEKEVTGDIYGVTSEANSPQVTGAGVIQTPIRDSEGQIRGYKPLTRTVSVEEQLYDKINEATKDYYSYTGDTLVPGQASEGSPNSFQTVLYKKEGDVLKPLTAPVSHGGWQNADVYTGGGGFKLSELLRGVAPVAALAIGGPLLDAALAGGVAATGSTAGAGGSIGGINLGGAFVPTAGSGASFALPAAAGAGGSIGGINLGGAFTPTAGSGASFTVPSATGGLIGPTYQELGITGVEGGLAGPTYAELGYTGLNNAEAIAAADAAAKGFSAKDFLSGANQAQKLAKLLTQGGSQVGRNMGVRSMPVANQMAQQPMLEQFGGLYRMNQNPFSFGTQGQTVASPGMYDVSGSNPMANALRKS